MCSCDASQKDSIEAGRLSFTHLAFLFIHVTCSSPVEFFGSATHTNQDVYFRDAFASNKTIIVPFAHCLGNRADQQKKPENKRFVLCVCSLADLEISTRCVIELGNW